MSQDTNWHELEECYQEAGLVLALGAGVSVGCNLPTWIQLLYRLSNRNLGAEGEALCKKLMASGYSFPAIASILEAKTPSGTEFSELIRGELYRDFPYFPEGITKENREDFIDFVQKNNTTMAAVARLCVRKGDSKSGYTCNPYIRAIVNFNLDGVLQSYTRERYKARILRTIERPSAGSKQGRINVYHMHGYFRFDKKYFRNLQKEAPDVRVFTEQEYFDFFNRPNSLFNYTFLYLLREWSCLFIGMSMIDENIRRLLHYSKTEREQSDAREGRTEDKAERRSIRHFAILPKSSNEIDYLTETSLERLGTRVLWITDFKEIPDRLAHLYHSTSDG
ncbi:MAG: SIR2 family protein [Chloroflexi bacterium]|nr:SIR2 family protein [Chloroflexota bacterium]